MLFIHGLVDRPTGKPTSWKTKDARRGTTTLSCRDERTIHLTFLPNFLPGTRPTARPNKTPQYSNASTRTTSAVLTPLATGLTIGSSRPDGCSRLLPTIFRECPAPSQQLPPPSSPPTLPLRPRAIHPRMMMTTTRPSVQPQQVAHTPTTGRVHRPRPIIRMRCNRIRHGVWTCTQMSHSFLPGRPAGGSPSET